MSLFYKSTDGGGGGGLTVVDDFEDGDIAEYSGDTANFGVVTSPTKNGSYALEYTGTTNNGAITDTNDLTHPGQGDTFRINIRTTSVSEGVAEVLWAVQSETGASGLDCYSARGNFAGGDFELNKYSSGGRSTLAEDTTVSYSTGVWYEIEVGWATDGTMTVTLYDGGGNQVAQVSATDTGYTSGGVGWLGNRGDSAQSSYYDYYRIV